MRSKYALLFLSLICVSVVDAQDLSVQKKTDAIDSLILHRNFKEGEKSLDHLYDSLANSHLKQNKKAGLELLLQKAYVYQKNEQISHSLKMALDIMEQAEQRGYYGIAYEACLLAAHDYEISDELPLCKIYLDKAYRLYRKNRLDSVYSHYCIRTSSYYRFEDNYDSALHFAYKGFAYAKRYNNKKDFLDACLLLGILLADRDFTGAFQYTSLAAQGFLERNDYYGAASMYNNIARMYIMVKNEAGARLYSDSAIWVLKTNSLPEDGHTFQTRHTLFDMLGRIDSAYHYFRKYHDALVTEYERAEATKIMQITEHYENDKKQAIIKSKDLQILFIVLLLTVIAAAAVLLTRKNRKINSQNKIIRRQVDELMKMLEQKQVLLAELQHRVKNNLQHIISILEIQKESVDFNDIDELIRGNQNRIHSMALLHRKLNVSADVDQVDLSDYIAELAELVRSSYDTQRKKISLDVVCEIDRMSIEKALPVGLITVELISNSIKHAFRKQNTGIIRIALSREAETGKNKLYYADNGSGFDFDKNSETGLGLEIIKGLIGQLDATVESRYSKGFELTLRF